jgi:hypothetical protein
VIAVTRTARRRVAPRRAKPAFAPPGSAIGAALKGGSIIAITSAPTAPA